MLIELFSLAITVEALWADIGRNFAIWKGGRSLWTKILGGKGRPPPTTNYFWHQRSRVPGLSYGEKKLPKSSTAWVGCTNVTDRQTDGIATASSEREREFTSAKNGNQTSVEGSFGSEFSAMCNHCGSYLKLCEVARRWNFVRNVCRFGKKDPLC